MPNNQSKKTSKIQKIIDKSGNNLHVQAVHALRDLDWIVEVSPYYNDNITDKSRELDIIAEKLYPFSMTPLEGPRGYVLVRLYIECKYIHSEATTAFWFDDKNLERASSLIESKMHLSSPKDNNNSGQHHYYTDHRVVKLFDSEARDVIQNAMNQCLNGTIYFRDQSPFIDINSPLPTFTLNYPIILTNTFDHFYATDHSAKAIHARITKPFQLEVKYAYLDRAKANQNEYFLLDVVDLPQLANFIVMLENSDIEIARKQLAVRQLMGQALDDAAYSNTN